jgi:hypothetical protein
VFFAVCALVIAEEAATNDRGLILEGIFRFSPHGATVFYWMLAGLSALFVLAALFLAVARLSTDRYLQLESDAVILPHGFLQTKLSRVPYSSIATVSEVIVKGQKSLRLHTSSRKYAISASLLPSDHVYVQLRQLIAERVGTEPIASPNPGSAGAPPASVS